MVFSLVVEDYQKVLKAIKMVDGECLSLYFILRDQKVQ